MTQKRIGVVGVGRMGTPMSRRLLAAGYDLTVTDVSSDAVARLAQEGAGQSNAPAGVAAASDVILLSLPTPGIVDAVAFGDGGLSEVDGKGKIVIDLSTTGPDGAKALAEGLSAKGYIVLDCPVSGGVGGAEAGTLALMASGDASAYETVRPMLETLGKPFLVGPEPGMGQMTKVMNNLLSVTALAATCEALVLGAKAGLDPKVLVDVINVSSGASNASMTKVPKFILSRSFAFGFPLELSTKDVRLCLEQAEAHGVPMVVGNATREMLRIAKATLGADADLTRIIEPMEAWAGVKIGEDSAS